MESLSIRWVHHSQAPSDLSSFTIHLKTLDIGAQKDSGDRMKDYIPEITYHLKILSNTLTTLKIDLLLETEANDSFWAAMAACQTLCMIAIENLNPIISEDVHPMNQALLSLQNLQFVVLNLKLVDFTDLGYVIKNFRDICAKLSSVVVKLGVIGYQSVERLQGMVNAQSMDKNIEVSDPNEEFDE